MIRSDGEDKFFVQTNLTNADKNTNESKTNKKKILEKKHACAYFHILGTVFFPPYNESKPKEKSAICLYRCTKLAVGLVQTYTKYSCFNLSQQTP